MIDSVIKVNKKYYSQTLLEGCKYEIIIKKIWELYYLSDESDSESDNVSNSESDKESEKRSGND